jgi:hypothetical protein
MRIPVGILFATILTAWRPSACPAEEPPDAPDTLRSLAPKVYIDCDDCDFDFLRNEIIFISFVRDRKLADVHVLVSEQTTGSGGTEYTLEFIGLGARADQADTLQVSVLESDSDDTIRRELTRAVKLGMVRHAARTPLGRHLDVEYKLPAQKDVVTDRWDYWVFQISGNTYLNGEESYHSAYFYGEIEARRVTEQTKTAMSVYGSYSDSRFEYTIDDVETTVLSLSRSKGLSATRSYSLGDHWSAGASASLYSSSYSNRDYDASLGPALEYNLFPYRESTRRQCRFIYNPRLTYVDYAEETIFDQRYEWLGGQNLSIECAAVQPWGSISSELTGSHYFHDFAKNRLNWYNKLSLNLVKGLSLDIQGNVSRVRNLLSLPRRGATEEEILLRRQQLATSYQYWVSIGFSYSFGSIYNNIVNPRFGD